MMFATNQIINPESAGHASVAGGLMVVGLRSSTAPRWPMILLFDPWYNQLYVRQIIWCLFGTGAAVATCLVDYRRLARFAMCFIGFHLASAAGFCGRFHDLWAKRWIDLGPFNLQPLNLPKLAFIFAFAHFLSRPRWNCGIHVGRQRPAPDGAPFLLI